MTRRQRAVVSADAMPALPAHIRLRFDPVRQATALLSPERVFWPDDISIDILRLCDGSRSVSAIVERLSADYGAPADEVGRDVADFLQEWADKLLVRL